MVPGGRRWRRAWRIGNAIIAACAAAAVLTLCAAGYRSWPALGPALDPGRGAWASATGGKLPASQALVLAGLSARAGVSFDAHGVPTVTAASSADAALALGYLHASFRLTQMDLARRQAEGRLAALLGARAVRSDEFELRLGLLRAARREWTALPKTSLAAQVLVAYAKGVNDYLAQLRSSRQWPALFALAGVYPANWTPVDSLAVQGDLCQQLDFTTAPLDYALLERSLGMRRTMAWFPARRIGAASPPGAAVARAAAAVLAEIRALAPGQASGSTEASSWAANGARVQGGGSMLAGYFELPRALPAGWFQAALSEPGMDVTGVSIPGLPVILAGHNRHIAWSVGGAQSQAARYFVERTTRSRPGQYFWRGGWRSMRRLRYQIAVRGGATRTLIVLTTVHGPVLTQAGATMTVDWTGSASPDTAALLAIGQAGTFAQFRAALRQWRGPAQTFAYADDRGHIGAVTAGAVPGRVGALAYDPASHLVVAAGQRYQAERELAFLGTRDSMRPATFARLQASMTDELAVQMVPRVLAALHGAKLSALAQQAAIRLRQWNREMTPGSPAASIWWTFWSDCLAAAFGPWWNAREVPVRLDRAGLAVSAAQPGLDQALEQRLLGNLASPLFPVPGEPAQSVRSVVRGAFDKTVVRLHDTLGGDPASWAWSKLHSREFTSPTLASALWPGPRPAGGDGWTVDVAGGFPVAVSGPEWRMIIRWPRGHGAGMLAEGTYPGGQSDNPASPWYANLAGGWWSGSYLPMPPDDGPAGGMIRWRLQP